MYHIWKIHVSYVTDRLSRTDTCWLHLAVNAGKAKRQGKHSHVQIKR